MKHGSGSRWSWGCVVGAVALAAIACGDGAARDAGGDAAIADGTGDATPIDVVRDATTDALQPRDTIADGDPRLDANEGDASDDVAFDTGTADTGFDTAAIDAATDSGAADVPIDTGARDTGTDAPADVATGPMHVHIDIDNFCRVTVTPASVMAGVSSRTMFAFHNHSRDYNADVWMSYGGGYLDLAQGATWNDPIGHCNTPTTHDEYADISIAGGGSSGCPSVRFMIRCR